MATRVKLVALVLVLAIKNKVGQSEANIDF